MKLLLPILIIFLSLSGICQDGHYWTEQYGTRSMLLGGSVIGGVDDLGAVFYNPGRLALIENPAFLLNSNVYEFNQLSIEDAFGERRKLSESSFSGIPSFVAGTFKLGFLKNHFFAYSILVKSKSDLGFTYRDETSGDVIDEYPGTELFEGELKIMQKQKEQWFGLTWSYAINQNLSVGVTTNVTRVTHNKGNEIDLRALTEMSEVAMYSYLRSYDYSVFSLLWKLGVAWELEKFHLGLTLTTPSLRVVHQGAYNYQQYFSGIRGVTVDDDIYENNYQDGLAVTNKTPFSIGIGSTFLFGKNKLHISGEWFNKIPEYTIARATDHIGQSTGDTIGFHVQGRMKSIFNAGLGFDIYLSEKVSLFTSFNTDFSAVPDNVTGFLEQTPEFHNSWLSADLYHFGLGVDMKFKGTHLTLGTSYTSASQNFDRPIDFPIEGGNNIFEQDEEGTFKWSRWRFVISFSFPFLKDLTKNSGIG